MIELHFASFGFDGNGRGYSTLMVCDEPSALTSFTIAPASYRRRMGIGVVKCGLGCGVERWGIGLIGSKAPNNKGWQAPMAA